jgi:hypothetical protein
VLPLVRPLPKPLRVRVGLTGETGEYFTRVLRGIPGVELGASGKPGLRVVAEDGAWATPPGAAIVVAAGALEPEAAAEARRKWDRAPLTAERHPLVERLSWQGLIGPGPAQLRPAARDELLLWQGDTPLVWRRAGEAAAGQLVLNLDWAASNAGRLPATLLLLRRHVETVRDARSGAYAANFDTGSPVPLAAADLEAQQGAEWTIVRVGGETRSLAAGERAVLRAPSEAGFFEVRRGDEVLVRGAAQFSDARQGDFKGAGEFMREPPAGEAQAAAERRLTEDRWAPLWLALAGAALLAAWWPGRSAAGAGGAASAMKRKEGLA